MKITKITAPQSTPYVQQKSANLENLRTNILQQSKSLPLSVFEHFWAFEQEFERCPIGNGGPGFGNGQTGGVADVASAVAAPAALQATWTGQKNIATHNEKQTTGQWDTKQNTTTNAPKKLTCKAF